MKPNPSVQAKPDYALRFIVAQVSGAPDATYHIHTLHELKPLLAPGA